MNTTSNGNDDGGIWIAVTVTPCVYLASWIVALVRGRPPCGHSFVDTGRRMRPYAQGVTGLRLRSRVLCNSGMGI